jgi:hypothetical protein
LGIPRFHVRGLKTIRNSDSVHQTPLGVQGNFLCIFQNENNRDRGQYNPKNKTLAIDRNDLDVPKVVSDPWTPIWSNLAFVVVMLTVSCWYLYRQDL